MVPIKLLLHLTQGFEHSPKIGEKKILEKSEARGKYKYVT